VVSLNNSQRFGADQDKSQVEAGPWWAVKRAYVYAMSMPLAVRMASNRSAALQPVLVEVMRLNHQAESPIGRELADPAVRVQDELLNPLVVMGTDKAR